MGPIREIENLRIRLIIDFFLYLFGRQRSAPSNQQMVPFAVHTVARQSDIVARGNDGVQADDLTVQGFLMNRSSDSVEELRCEALWRFASG